MEHRYFQMSEVHTRSEEDALYLEGMFARYDDVYVVAEGATESIAPGAFAESITGDVRALYNHNHDLVLGRTRAGTLELKDTETGLWGRIKLNKNDSQAMDAYSRIARGDVTGCSFGFEIPPGGETTTVRDDGTVHWTITKVSPLYEISPAVFPAYEKTYIYAREKSMEEIQKRKKDAELATWKANMRERMNPNGNQSIDAEEETGC